MIKIAVGHSEDVDSLDAIIDVLEQCDETLNGLMPNAGILYTALGFDFQIIIDEIMNKYPNLELIGCTTDGEISSKLGCVEDSVTLTLFYSDTIEIKCGVARNLSNNKEESIKNAIKKAKEGITKPLNLGIIIAESMTIGGVAILEECKKNFGSKFPLFGGLSADQWNMSRTYQFYKNEILEDSFLILIFAGNMAFSSGIASGWFPVGHKKKVSKVKNNVVYELENEPILDFYNKYLEGSYDYSRVPTEYPLAVYPEDEDVTTNKFYIRSPHTFSEKDKSITFFGDIPNNTYVQLVTGSSDKISAASESALKQAVDTFKGIKPLAALVFTCSARKALLGMNVTKEYEYLVKAMPEDFLICGFYTYGEIGPLDNGTESRFHNGTILVLLIGED
jgi:hypothetical protein